MRAIWFTIPIGIALAGAGTLLLVKANEPPPQANTGIDFALQPKHFVTPQMIEETAKQALMQAPKFEEKDVLGNLIKIGTPSGKPQFVLFILDGCPCSVDAQPLFNRFYRHFGGSVDFIGVTNGDMAKARDWKIRYSVPFPVVPDPSLKIIHAFKAKHSVYSSLVGKEGTLAKVWPGYSYDMMIEMNKVISKLAGVNAKPFDPTYAPREKATGCAF